MIIKINKSPPSNHPKQTTSTPKPKPLRIRSATETAVTDARPTAAPVPSPDSAPSVSRHRDELKPDITVAGCIDIFENAWPNPQETIKLLEKECSDPESGIVWIRAETLGRGTNQSVRTNYNIGISYFAQETGNSLAQNIHNEMYAMLIAAATPYAKKHEIEEMHHESYNVLKYSTGQEYKPHFDGATGTGRAISAICYWNDDYEGGELEFPNFRIKIKPEPGMLLLFPSNYAYTHIAHPVTNGTKYGIVTWIKDRPL